MASFTAACRLSARLASRQLRQDASARGFRTSTACLAAQNFTMPALSPTMTEGNIAKWAVKEGDSFVAGDILLEIETDKASMDVEAQDDGIMAKIFQGDGAKGIKVGVRIGVLAEPGDDLSSLEIPTEDNQSSSSPKEETKSASSAAKSEATPSKDPSSANISSVPMKKSSSPAKEQTRPLLPSVEHLMHQHNIDPSKISEMTPSGPNNRLLKGDVLAYLGTVSSSYPAELSSKISKLSHLDLSNIKLAAPAPKPAVIQKAAVPTPEPVKESQIQVPISMKAVLEVQKRIQSTLGVFMPLSTFIARATEVANDDLPRSKFYKPTADDLFNSILGLDKVDSTPGVRGTFLPQVQALPSAAPRSTSAKSSVKKNDIIDILSGRKTSVSSKPSGKPLPGLSNVVNVFSLSVPAGDEKRAQIFLQRMRTVLEAEPGRLVL
ncbi:related to pyruvate dehydrogenase complex protein X precursor, dihydrolipoamide acetyltransferase component [Rhynchosporium secalis]|uniref:Related to pyruvate dehydrogenase complex protein X, dihydrolipoamide acetyltransferase component n=1 Tax=Rhynchosporium secalis TaxID=38038 RepID=A0A1E1MKI0_RHYSE|nr:related to pyruvate dehydrogenase complex protein X precursor, dihydrolipoamide acetyltransferase component [Rhynchosporium secalis]